MADKEENLRDNVRHEKVVLEKVGHHVEVYGPYTKKELRRLLLSSLSLYPETDNEKRILEEIGLDEQELRNIKNGNEVSERAQKTLEDLEITEDMIREAANETESSRSGEMSEKMSEGKETKITKEEVKSISDEKQEKDDDIEKRKLSDKVTDNFIQFLQEKNISNDLINQLLQNGITEETIRLLKSLDLSAEDIDNLEKLGQIQINNINDSVARNLKFGLDESDYNFYLKNYLFIPIRKGICEIILRKPKDPIDFLGQWLLHFKVCEDKEKKRKEYEMELLLEREKVKIMENSENVIQYSSYNKDQRENEEFENSWEFVDDNVVQ